MGRYVKKPVVVEAVRLNDNAFPVLPLPDWLMEAALRSDVTHKGERLLIRTLEGVMEAGPGDWIIQGVKGELYPCKHDIFIATYEVAPDAERV